MSDSFLHRKKSIELIMNKIAVTIVLAIFITAYIPNFFMDANMQSSFHLPAEQMVLYYKRRGNENRDNVESCGFTYGNIQQLKQKKKPLFWRNIMETLASWVYFKGKGFTSLAIILS